jgi:hypothetical protein
MQRAVIVKTRTVSEIGFCLRLRAKPPQLGPIDRANPEIGTSSIDWVQLSTFHLKTETESSLRSAML